MFKTWWKSIMFKANFTFLYRIFESLSSWLIRSFLLYISSRNDIFRHHLYVKEIRKVALAALNCKNLRMTLWSSQIFRNWRSRRSFLRLISLFSNFLTNFKILSPYLFFRTSAIERFVGKRSPVWNINTKHIATVVSRKLTK